MFESSLEDEIDIRILPLIDVIFFLLIFFMMFTTFRSSPTGININLPQAETVTKQEKKRVAINISQSGQVYVDEQLVGVDNLVTRIEEIIAANSPETLFIINADQEVAYKQIITVMDKIRRAGGYRLALAAERETSN